MTNMYKKPQSSQEKHYNEANKEAKLHNRKRSIPERIMGENRKTVMGIIFTEAREENWVRGEERKKRQEERKKKEEELEKKQEELKRKQIIIDRVDRTESFQTGIKYGNIESDLLEVINDTSGWVKLDIAKKSRYNLQDGEKYLIKKQTETNHNGKFEEINYVKIVQYPNYFSGYDGDREGCSGAGGSYHYYDYNYRLTESLDEVNNWYRKQNSSSEFNFC